jgi:hypothetical protein
MSPRSIKAYIQAIYLPYKNASRKPETLIFTVSYLPANQIFGVTPCRFSNRE